MIETKMKIEQFKRECKSINFYEKIICEISQLISKSNNLNEEIILKNKKEDYINRKMMIYKLIEKIEDDIDREMVIEAFINQRYYKDLIKLYNYNDSSALYRHLNHVIEKIIKYY